MVGLGASAGGLVALPWPRFRTGFDDWSNLLGYAPLGFLLSLAMLRSDGRRWVWAVAFGVPTLLSLGVETLQNYLPMRVPSNVDLALNSAGAALGASCAWALERLGALRRERRIRFEDLTRLRCVLEKAKPFIITQDYRPPLAEQHSALLRQQLSETPQGLRDATPRWPGHAAKQTAAAPRKDAPSGAAKA